MKPSYKIFKLLTILFLGTTLHGHHFKGLPHYNYFENYPQVPEEEFLGQAAGYEFSLVVYDFQGIQRDDLDEPNTVRLFLVIFKLLTGSVYTGPVTLEVLDGSDVFYTERQESGKLENLYSIHESLPDDGNYTLRITLHDDNDAQCLIPFTLSSQKKHWGIWIAAAFVIMILIAAVGARKARITQDRKDEMKRRRENKQHGTT